MQIKRLEAVVGAKLFDRTKRSVKLTNAGEQLWSYAQQMLRLQEEALSSFGKAALTGLVRLGATDTSMCYLPRILPRFAQVHPLTELEIRCDRSWEALDALDAGEVDLALVTQPCGRRGGQVVCREALIWALARGSAASYQAPLPLAIFAPGCIYRDAALKALDVAGRNWRHAYSSPSRSGLDVAVAAGLAVTIVPQSALTPELRPVDAAAGLPPLPDIEILLFRRAKETSAAVVSLAEVLITTLGTKA
jgi:DNA-binding transcriptional LysR family regulator